ncbi:UDP-N-acetylmuramoyl-tripeptide--D-alanyl-D-alanine ligase [Pseudohongiella sp.]|uniref:UDP-MurNAc-pentapeptide synthetase n=1 Tax=marine sediment metagenome TaxID=412755 RepID=A0A0F9VJX2_9ZZZZ|nr:UDP-N-acetylmuramoyl-tripeptide--D-alanyl-D-alanine ligase [Pseudohongiella sp.]HDZ10419.1 UDP-N-acetylmuramoyl-tripeptide--D-alanyl-D-alanine ligase [Pseudohongiella sp.]HEA61958.1 UDP-N-acetylmuramoyl-tripeptide--D-alanyl-D-alanine ligase [Pseudohongiella sp.]
MIGTMTLSDVSEYMPATMTGADVTFSRVNTDSRQLQAGDLFVALSGENFNGNRFVSRVAEQRAVAAIVSEAQDVPIPQLVVADTAAALGWLGHINRKRSRANVVAITGSQGKTSVKEMTGSILSQQFNILVTRGNLNNNIGAPMMLLELEQDHQQAIIELGANAGGEIAWTAKLVDPQIVLINNAAETHLEGFGSLAGVVQAKGEIIDSAASTHTVVLNADDPNIERWRERAGRRRCVTFALDAPADYRAVNLVMTADGARFDIESARGRIACFLPLPGRHNVANALAAAALSIESGATSASVCDGLARVAAVPGRLCPLSGINNSRLLDDSYNASPSSFRAAIDVLAVIRNGKDVRRVLVMGDMAELGALTVQAHRDVGSYARECGLDELWSTGACSELASQSFGAGGRHFEDRDALISHAAQALNESSVVLVKGSRSAGMDYVVQQLSSKETV